MNLLSQVKRISTGVLASAALIGGSLLAVNSARADEFCGYSYRWSNYYGRCVPIEPIYHRPPIVVVPPRHHWPVTRPVLQPVVYPGYRPYPSIGYPRGWGGGIHVSY